MNVVLFSRRLLWRSGETSCNFLLIPLGILSCASCSSPLRATTAFMSGMVDLTRSLCLRYAPLSLLVAESFTLLYISGFSKGVFINEQFSGISEFLNSSFCESSSLAFPPIFSKTCASLVSIDGPKSSWTDPRSSLYELSWSPSTSTSESTLEYLLSGSSESFLWQVLSSLR